MVDKDAPPPPKTPREINIEAGIRIDVPIALERAAPKPYVRPAEELPFPWFYWIQIRTFTGREFKVAVEADWTIAKVKERIEEKEGIPCYCQRLLWRGRQINDYQILEDVCHSRNGSASRTNDRQHKIEKEIPGEPLPMLHLIGSFRSG